MLRKRFAQALIGVAMVGAGAVATQSPAAAATQGPYSIKGQGSNKCIMSVPTTGHSNGARQQMYTCMPADYYDHQWWFDDTDSGYYNIRNQSTNGCMTVLNNSTAQNQPIISYDCNRGDNAEWRTERLNPGSTGTHWYRLVSRRSGKCLTVKNASTANNVELLQYTCNGGSNQAWTWYRPS